MRSSTSPSALAKSVARVAGASSVNSLRSIGAGSGPNPSAPWEARSPSVRFAMLHSPVSIESEALTAAPRDTSVPFCRNSISASANA
jgi:hypothetical protein